MKRLKPKEQHERLLANVDREKIVQHLNDGAHHDITQIATALARQCNLFVHFKRLWLMRVSDLNEKLGTEHYICNISTAIAERSAKDQPGQTHWNEPATD